MEQRHEDNSCDRHRCRLRHRARPPRSASPPKARAVACLDVKGYDETAAGIVADGGRAWGYECDVTDDGAVRRAVDLAFSELGGLNVVCNVAGIGQFYRTETLDPAVFDRIIAVNLRGTFLVCRYALPHMLEAGGGVIVNTTSVSGIVGNPWNAAYAASKGGVLMLTKALAAEYRHRGVRVNGVAPGMVATDLSAGFTDFFANEDIDLCEFGRGQPVRAAPPDEIAATFAFVASADAAYMSGAIVVLDGGATSVNAWRRALFPVVVGVGQVTQRDDDDVGARGAARRCCSTPPRAAEADAGARLLDQVDAIELMPIGAWSYDDLPGLVVERLGLDPARVRPREHPVGGETPIRALDAAAARIAAGDARVVLLAGAEGTRAVTRARKAGRRAAWTPPGSRSTIPTMDPVLQRAAAVGIGRAIHCFPLYEHALRAHEGVRLADAQAESGMLWAGLTEVAAANPYAWSRARCAARTTSPTCGPTTA